MTSAVIVFPGSNCDRDLAVAFRQATGTDPHMVWHKETSLPAGIDLLGLPGGFSYGDYLRCGAIAARSPIMNAVRDFANGGGPVLGICNGFQVLIEAGLLPGALLRNAGLTFLCDTVGLQVRSTQSPFTSNFTQGQKIRLPVAHHDGNYFAPQPMLETLHREDRIAFTYTDNPNGSAADIAGILSENRRVLGMMPHPERAADPALGLTDGTALFSGLAEMMAAA